MKKIFMLMASAAIVFAASCNKIEEVNTPEPVVETELITVDLNPMTKTSLEGKATVWSEGDKVSVTVGGKKIGDLELVKGTTSTFKGEVEAGHNDEATLNYPAGVTSVPASQKAVKNSFANGAALLEGKTTMDALRAGKGATLSNTTALLQFEVSIAGDVAFTIGDKTYTVTGCEAGNTYYACVDPNTSGKLSYTVGIVLGAKEKENFTPEAKKIYPLGTLELKKSNWAIVGSVDKFGSWNAANSQYYFYESENYYVALNVPFATSDKFKFVKDGNAWYSVSSMKMNEWINLVNASDLNITEGNYDIYILKNNNKVYIAKSGTAVPQAPAQGCKLIVKVNKKYNWWNKYIYAWDTNGKALCGNWPGTVLTWIKEEGDYYLYYHEFSADYNNKTINYHVNGGGDDTKTKDGSVKLVSPETTITVD